MCEAAPGAIQKQYVYKRRGNQIQLKPRQYQVQQKTRPIPLHHQEAVGEKLENLTKS